jgi:hypothetical protein
MRKLFILLVVSVLLMTALVPTALAEPKPNPDTIPYQADPPGGFNDYWIELKGVGTELPGTSWDFGTHPADDDFVRGGAITGDGFQEGLPVGFTFHYMDGPARGVVTAWVWIDHDNDPNTPDIAVADRWATKYMDEGYKEVYVGTNGYIVFDTGGIDDAGNAFIPQERPIGEFQGLAKTDPWNPPTSLPTMDVPNNFIAPYWTDLAIEDNTFLEVTSVGFVCTGDWEPGGELLECRDTAHGGADRVESPADCVCTKTEIQIRSCPGPDPGCFFVPGSGWFRVVEVPICGPVTGFWMPCGRRQIFRPRGQLLFATVGDAPSRKFVVQWENARNTRTGNLATFQVQLWESGGQILFLYKEFRTKAMDEDPPHETAYVVNPALLVGMENWFGNLGVGWRFLPQFSGYMREDPVHGGGVGWWQLFNPYQDLDMIGFVADEYVADPLNPWQ